MDVSLPQIARRLVAEGKGVFAADASPKTLARRAAEIGLTLDTVEQRLAYREMTLDTPDLSRYIGGVILHEEAMGLAKKLIEGGILPGIKVDQGTGEMVPGSSEKITQGLEGLDQRLVQFRQRGAKFTKWRAVFTIAEGRPTTDNIARNSFDLAQYAYLSQQSDLVPIVEPEVLMDGEHSLERCAQVTELVGKQVFQALQAKGVDPSALLYKPNMVVAGKDCPNQLTNLEVAQKTVAVMQSVVPASLPAIVFLSGGQDAVLATQRLNEIAVVGRGSPWRWSFSFERALEGPALRVWAGREENIAQAQKVLLHRAKCNNLASLGQYNQGVEDEI